MKYLEFKMGGKETEDGWREYVFSTFGDSFVEMIENVVIESYDRLCVYHGNVDWIEVPEFMDAAMARIRSEFPEERVA